jgi:choloylglycine hydrolase
MSAGRNYFSIIATVILVFLLHIQIEACSLIFWNNKVNKVVARTMDLSIDESPSIVVLPRGLKKEGQAGQHSIKWSSRYGSIAVTAFGNHAISEGMNEKGLSAHVLYLEGTEYETRDSRPGLSNALWVLFFLDNLSFEFI